MTNNLSQNQKATEKVETQNNTIINNVSYVSNGNNGNGNITRKRRGAISSEPLGDKPATPLPNIPKTVETQQRLEQALSNNIMFSHLEEEERNVVFLAMVEVLYKAGDIIIKQGDEGDLFYVIDQGICDIYVSTNGSSPTLVMEVFEGGSFGELALIYGSPRAATVIARTDVRLWALNGATYRRILMDQTIKKRKLYEEFLEKVSILRHIDKYERVSLADALEPVSFQDGEVIVKQGDPGDRFYIIVEGKVVVTQETTPGDPSTSQVVAELHPSDYFGEIALLTDRPRAATVTSIGYTKCVELDRQRFNRLCGPIDQMLRRNMETYNQYINRANSPTLTSQKY